MSRRAPASVLFFGALVVACSDGASEDATTLDAGVPDAAEQADVGAGPDAGDAPDAEVIDLGEPPLGVVVVDTSSAAPPRKLSDFRFFRFREGRIEYNAGVVPYELNSALFSDFALKRRAIWLPAGQHITFTATAAFDFPVGSAIVKSFLFAPDLRTPDQGVRMIETRLLIRYPSGWKVLPYLWRADQTDADYFVRGETIAIDFIDPYGRNRTAQYLVPQRNQCFACHDQLDANGQGYTTIIGPKARHLNRSYDYGAGPVNQLEHLADIGYLVGLPALSTVEQAFDFEALASTTTTAIEASALEHAARSYLDVNCAHCHNPRGLQGVTSQFFLNYDNNTAFNLGVCKEPGSAGNTGGRRYDIVPGDPEASILSYRMETETVGVMMPLLGRSLADDLGTRFVRAWIARMPAQSCP